MITTAGAKWADCLVAPLEKKKLSPMSGHKRDTKTKGPGLPPGTFQTPRDQPHSTQEVNISYPTESGVSRTKGRVSTKGLTLTGHKRDTWT